MPKPYGQLLSCHVCKSRTGLVSTNSFLDLQTMEMIMVGINLFFHFDDIDGLAVHSFIPEQFVLDPATNIMGMCLKVLGKADKDWRTLMLWTDEECPEFCPIHLLLVYSYASKSQGHFLFLSKVECIKVNTTIPHNDFNHVKKWIPILLTSPSSATLLTVKSIPLACNVVELANQFIVHHLQVSTNHPCATSSTFLCDKSLNFVRPKQAAKRITNLFIYPVTSSHCRATYVIGCAHCKKKRWKLYWQVDLLCLTLC